MRGIFPTLLAFGFGLYVLWLVWSLLNRSAKQRRTKLLGGDIERSASEFIEQHGDAADAAVTKLAEQCLAIGDFEGEAIWKLVAKEIAKLQAEKPDAV